MKTILFASALLLTTGAAIPAFAADPVPATAAPEKAMPATEMHGKPMMHHMHPMHGMHTMHGAKGAAMMHPAREKTTDELNQQQLDKSKS